MFEHPLQIQLKHFPVCTVIRMASVDQKTQSASWKLRKKRPHFTAELLYYASTSWGERTVQMMCSCVIFSQWMIITEGVTAHLASQGSENKITSFSYLYCICLHVLLWQRGGKKGNTYEVRTFSWTKAIVTGRENKTGNNETHEECFNSWRSNLMEWTDVKQEQVGE